jgi:hypothetical protein
MRTVAALLLFLAATLTVVIGCSDDTTAPPDPNSSSGLIEGEIGTTDFEISVASAGGREGPFVLRGSNLHYEDSLQALVVDLTVTHRGEVAHSEPIGLTFVQLIPEDVTVLNPDNGVHGEGAAIMFAFANDDGRWTPGETSLPRTVEFGVAKGTSIGFSARLDIGEPVDGGTIAGRVWNDADQDGVIDDGEHGIPGVRVDLRDIDDDSTLSSSSHRRSTHTDARGSFAFHRLPAGAYVVSKAPSPYLTPTTPSEITVLLTEAEGDVSDFLDANFGCVPMREPPFLVGMYIRAAGVYVDDAERLEAKEIEVRRCTWDSPPGLDNVLNCRQGRLRGPVTAIDENRFSFAVMGAWIVTDAMNIPPDVEVGDRLDVLAHRADNGIVLIGEDMAPWEGEHEEVQRRIDSVDVGDDGVVRLRVMNVTVVVSHDRLVRP